MDETRGERHFSRPGLAGMDRLAIGPQVANLPHNHKGKGNRWVR
jgi:hypothetical protein